MPEKIGLVLALAEVPPDPPTRVVPPPPPLETLPLEQAPEPARQAIAKYAAAPDRPARTALVAVVDRCGHAWERSIADRSIEVGAELAATCSRLMELHDELVNLRAQECWLRSFPWCSSWRPEAFTVHVIGGAVEVPEIIGAIADACDAGERLRGIARAPASSEPVVPPLAAAPWDTPAPSVTAAGPAGPPAVPRRSSPCPLSPKQLAALRGLARGLMYADIAGELGCSTSTVRTHLHTAYNRLGVRDRAQAVLIALDRGWIERL